ncbi:YcaO-like family protein [Micromonospora sp. DT62]|uniref:YcaO-like family protein n=1 Tax=Micromonospora sp. DT62 TaxID=3416521 RepID=UPI003CE82C64
MTLAQLAGSWLKGGGPAALAAGTVRTHPVARTRARLTPLLPRWGITRVAELTGLDTIGVPVFSALRPGAATLVASAGKGLTDDAAWVSAVMESLEVAAAETFACADPLVGTAAEIGCNYLVEDLPLHPVSVAAESTVLEWTAGLDLVTGDPARVPVAAVGLRGWTEQRWQPPLFVTTTNGLAGGNTHVEAALHGLLELVERDALSRVGPRSARVSTAPAAVGPRVAALAELVRDAGATIELEFLASLPGTATCVCYLSQPEMPQLFGGSGCHLDPEIAAERAVLEAIQSRASVISGTRDDIPAAVYHGALTLGHQRRAAAGAWTVPDPRPLHGADVAGLLDGLAATVTERTGRPVIAVDLTPDGVEFPAVVQVFAPGMAPAPEAPRPAADGRKGP